MMPVLLNSIYYTKFQRLKSAPESHQQPAQESRYSSHQLALDHMSHTKHVQGPQAEQSPSNWPLLLESGSSS